MALELGEYSIRVNCIAPGLFMSEITAALMQKEWLKTVCERTVPLRTYGTSDPALTSLVRYLIHDSSDYVTGNIFIVDSGVTLPGVPIFSSLWSQTMRNWSWISLKPPELECHCTQKVILDAVCMRTWTVIRRRIESMPWFQVTITFYHIVMVLCMAIANIVALKYRAVLC